MKLLVKNSNGRYIINSKKDYFIRLPIWLLIILFFTTLPLIIGLIGAYFSELITGNPCHEGNCFWMVIPWFSFLTIPIGLMTFVIFVIVLILDTIKLLKK